MEALLLYLLEVGFDGAPRFLGVDDRNARCCRSWTAEAAGRPWPDWVADDERIVSVAELVRR